MKMRSVQYLGYAVGDAANNLTFSMVSAILVCASSLLFLTGMFSMQTVGVYYARDVLGNADLYIVMTVVQTVGMIIASLIVPEAVEAVGKRRTYLVAGVVAAIAGVGVVAAPGSVPAGHRLLRCPRTGTGRHQHPDLRAAGRHCGLR